ncbi:ccch zinc finger DNA-binding protein [Grosmannia clavigera kw1407]|uniref:Ccch zinc finger DNA-binding protein n=1 Tax=Grosmannia clavigera (strain kw1407 / UAMH 11150) TaxID=655863 RepID=F0XDU7_GROCL|nr:ccch zinc finger DNA-binding protein [Grosmannia clavigera kw1407]EFX04057.1 ccch zinc finger DNA-binding protein [Grosmannia clavigera kw1407]
MTSEDRELLARISQLAAYHPYVHPYRPRGGYRGKPAAYRNRTLVLNCSSNGDKSDGTDAPQKSESLSANGNWVSKTDRHMQLINSTVYEKEAPARTKAIEQTRLHNQKMKDDRERAKLQNHLRYLANSHGGSVGGGSSNYNANGRAPTPYQIVVQGISFHVVKNGSKLVKAPGDPNPPSSTPKTAIVGGVKFFRSKNGNLYRHGVVKAQRRAGNVKKIDQPCKIFSTTGPFCRYIHDPVKVAVCKEFLQKGHCASGDDCDLSHELTAERTPFCLHYAKGSCTNPNCPYTHSEVSTGALVCRPFGLYGYCEKGADCLERHVFECPDFSNTGVCKVKGCKLPHRERASFMRRANIASLERDADAEDADMVDASSDESVHSDDVDSDEVDEFVGADGNDADLDFVTQKDFIEF